MRGLSQPNRKPILYLCSLLCWLCCLPDSQLQKQKTSSTVLIGVFCPRCSSPLSSAIAHS